MARVLPGTAPHIVVHSQADMRPAVSPGSKRIPMRSAGSGSLCVWWIRCWWLVPHADPIVADGLASAAQRLCAALYWHCRERQPGPGTKVGCVSEPPFTFEYSASARLVRGVYLPITLTVEDRTTSYSKNISNMLFSCNL